MRLYPFALALLFTTSALALEKAPLPPQSATKVARDVRRSDPRIEESRQQYLLKKREGKLAPSAKKIAEEAHLTALALDARAALEGSKDKRGKLIILEGLDLSGKSSLAVRLEAAFKGLKVRTVHWGKPGQQKGALWQDDYLAEMPKENEIVIWDRSYMGRLIYDRHYGMIDDKTVDKRIKEVNGLEAMAKNQVDIEKFFYDVPGKEMARRIGKREALNPGKLDKKSGDYTAFRDRKPIRARADYAVDRTGESVKWHVVDMKDSFKGRVEILKTLTKRWKKAE